MSDEPKGEEKKIIIDEDWKTQVEAEKQAAEQGEQAEQAPAEDDSEGQLPPPNLTFLASTMYLQGMVSLGMLPNPATDKPEVHLDHAKHAIDTLQMLHEKTEGNRTEQETAELEAMLHELRMTFVAVQKQQGE